jgi:hypothetical protein
MSEADVKAGSIMKQAYANEPKYMCVNNETKKCNSVQEQLSKVPAMRMDSKGMPNIQGYKGD